MPLVLGKAGKRSSDEKVNTCCCAMFMLRCVVLRFVVLCIIGKCGVFVGEFLCWEDIDEENEAGWN